MLRLAKILDHIRKTQRLPQKNIAKFIGMTVEEYRCLLSGWKRLTPIKAKMICEFLQLNIQDYAPIYQWLERENLFYTLRKLNHFKKLDDNALQAISDAIYFELEGTEFNSIIYSQILSKIYVIPQEIRNAITEIRANQDHRVQRRNPSS